MIPVNHKLWALIKGRVLQAADSVHDGIVLRFEDASTMHIKTPQPPSTADIESVRGGSVAQVRQQNTSLVLTFDSGKQLSLQTTEPSASVLLRDGDGKLEYAD